MSQCGQCKQFISQPENEKDLCGAWQQATTATSLACHFFFPEKPTAQERAVDENREP